MPRATSGTVSPFFKRAYGGYTDGQRAFMLQNLDVSPGKVLLDPMGGQAYGAEGLCSAGATLWVGDIDPAPLLLATLRNPTLLRRSAEVARFALDRVGLMSAKESTSPVLTYEAGWLAPPVRDDLATYFDLAGLESLSSPFVPGSTFWRGPEELRFAASVPVLAARELACFTPSDNVTWMRSGGLRRDINVKSVLHSAIVKWMDFAARYRQSRSHEEAGTVFAELMNAEHGLFGSSPRVNAIFTSPPYANRLDYTRMWAPELETLSAMWGGDSYGLRSQQIGSNVIRNKSLDQVTYQILPPSVQEALDTIKTDTTSKASATYYYPFFYHYATALTNAMIETAKRILPGGSLVVFVRDTVRKDVLFPSGELVRHAVVNNCQMEEVSIKKTIVKNHIGLRRGTSPGVYGLAQHEWWLAFRRKCP